MCQKTMGNISDVCMPDAPDRGSKKYKCRNIFRFSRVFPFITHHESNMCGSSPYVEIVNCITSGE